MTPAEAASAGAAVSQAESAAIAASSRPTLPIKPGMRPLPSGMRKPAGVVPLNPNIKTLPKAGLSPALKLPPKPTMAPGLKLPPKPTLAPGLKLPAKAPAAAPVAELEPVAELTPLSPNE